MRVILFSCYTSTLHHLIQFTLTSNQGAKKNQQTEVVAGFTGTPEARPALATYITDWPFFCHLRGWKGSFLGRNGWFSAIPFER